MSSSYRGNIRALLMRGKIFRQQGSKLSGKSYRRQLNTITDSGSGFPMGGTISHRPTVGRVLDGMESQFENLRVSAKKANKPNAKYKPLKFNF